MDLFKRKDKKELQETSFKCNRCSMEFNDKDRLRRHTRKAHSKSDGDMPNPNPFGGF
jgi:uncharacterized C2H2 Zn-finger protein